MAEAKKPEQAKLFIGIIFSLNNDIEVLIKKLESEYGQIDSRSSFIPFGHTQYYSEMGGDLQKIFISFEKLIERENISQTKLFTNSLEIQFSPENERIFNIDPGYMTLANVFLASCKDFYHRMYQRDGVFLENELYYSSGEYNFWDWTYPDYKKQEYLDFFYALRKMYHIQLKNNKQSGK